MPVRALDHLALTVADVERTLAFYRRALGAEVLYEDLWRAGKLPVVILQVGASRLSIHAAEKPAAPHARVPTAGSADVCFRWDGPLDAAETARGGALPAHGAEGPIHTCFLVPAEDYDAWRGHLDASGVPVIQEVRWPLGRSMYFRDPDGNLLELADADIWPR